MRYRLNLEPVVIVVLLMTHLSLLINILSNVDDQSEVIRQALSEMGYAVDTIDFKLMGSNTFPPELIYQSSEPICYDGLMVDHWGVNPVYLSMGISPRLSVRPYIKEYDPL